MAAVGGMKLLLKAGCEIMKDRIKQFVLCSKELLYGAAYNRKKCGSVLVLVVVVMVVLSSIGMGLLAVSYGVRHRAIMLKNETAAMLAAEAGYEQAVFWMAQQQDMLTSLYQGVSGTTGSLTFPDGSCNYSIGFYTFVDARPVYRIIANGHSGIFNKTVDTFVVQEISGWSMGKCRIPTGSTTTTAVNYMTGEIIDMPLHINNLKDSPDSRDIYISGTPQFLRPVAMGESRYTGGGSDKYSGVMGLFTGGIYFSQPDVKISDGSAVQSKIDRFRDSTDADYQFTPTASAGAGGFSSSGNSYRLPAVQLEFFVDAAGVGKVRITNNCTVRGFRQSQDSRTYDFKITPGSDPETYQRYYIYGYHVRPSTDNRIIQRIDDTYVTQSFGGIESEPGGQIYVNGNVVIGSADPNLAGTLNVVKDKITVVATGNIWVANNITVDGSRDAVGKPASDNPNVLGLITQGVVKVVDPGMADYSYVDNQPNPPSGTVYVPIGLPDTGQPASSYLRHLPNPTVAEAAITVGGGGWGAENVVRGSYGGRKNTNPSGQDTLIVRGSLVEVMRGIVGSGSDGYIKQYYLDERLLEGLLPGDVWLQGKYVPAPAGWHDYRN
jgi:hypothetical protein